MGTERNASISSSSNNRSSTISTTQAEDVAAAVYPNAPMRIPAGEDAVAVANEVGY